ncbi:MAG: hypothetical protein JW929_04105 [Anaerolineales bacterium]|nr:hypothetical protein [Anaerolineales bacterium]
MGKLNELGAVEVIKERVQKLYMYQIGVLSLPLGLLWLGLGSGGLIDVLERRVALFADPNYSLILHLGQALVMFVMMIVAGAAGYALYSSYSGKFGAWAPYFGVPRKYWVVVAFFVILFAAVVILHCWLEPVFPWLGAAVGLSYALQGLLDKPKRWYYPAVALTLAAVSFLPLLSGADGTWTRAVCFLTFGLTLVFLGWLDHVNLFRIHRSLPEAADGTTV